MKINNSLLIPTKFYKMTWNLKLISSFFVVLSFFQTQTLSLGAFFLQPPTKTQTRKKHHLYTYKKKRTHILRKIHPMCMYQTVYFLYAFTFSVKVIFQVGRRTNVSFSPWYAGVFNLPFNISCFYGVVEKHDNCHWTNVPCRRSIYNNKIFYKI